MSHEPGKLWNRDDDWTNVLSRRIYAVTNFQPVVVENIIDVLKGNGSVSDEDVKRVQAVALCFCQPQSDP